MNLSPQQIIDDVFMIDKSITLAFPHKSAFNNFRAHISTTMRRMIDRCESIGMPDPFNNLRLKAQKIAETPHLTYRFSLGTHETYEPNFHILSIDNVRDIKA